MPPAKAVKCFCNVIIDCGHKPAMASQVPQARQGRHKLMATGGLVKKTREILATVEPFKPPGHSAHGLEPACNCRQRNVVRHANCSRNQRIAGIGDDRRRDRDRHHFALRPQEKSLAVKTPLNW